MKRKETIKKIIFTILIFILGIITSLLVIYKYPNIFKINTTKLEKSVTITDNGISDAVEKVYDKVIIVTTYNNNQKYSSGSGFIYGVDKESTYIITNNHVVTNSNNYKVTYTDGKEVSATLVGSDVYSDIAVLKVKTREDYDKVSLGNSNNLKPGDTTFVVGAPLNNEYSWTVTRGIISGKERLVEISTTQQSSSDYVISVLQTDAAVNSGNSGGPLCNANGDVIGVVSAKISGTGVEGMGFAIPIETAKEKADQIINGKNTTYPYLGISMINLSDLRNYPNYYNYLQNTKLTNGVVVIDVENNSSAKKAGLQQGDIITKIDNNETNSVAYLRYELYKHKVNDTITITYERNAKTKTVKVKLTSNGQKM